MKLAIEGPGVPGNGILEFHNCVVLQRAAWLVRVWEPCVSKPGHVKMSYAFWSLGGGHLNLNI